MNYYTPEEERERYLKLKKERPWYKHWKACRQRCNDVNAANYKYYGGKGIKCEITVDEIKELWLTAKADKMKQPQLSRKNHDLNYTFENCEFLEKKVNVGESNIRAKSKPVEMYSLDGKFIREFASCRQAGAFVNRKMIQDALRGRSKTCGGFIWRYKDVD